jgi:hypothetical protein
MCFVRLLADSALDTGFDHGGRGHIGFSNTRPYSRTTGSTLTSSGFVIRCTGFATMVRLHPATFLYTAHQSIYFPIHARDPNWDFSHFRKGRVFLGGFHEDHAIARDCKSELARRQKFTEIHLRKLNLCFHFETNDWRAGARISRYH